MLWIYIWHWMVIFESPLTAIVCQGCHLAFKKAKSALFGLFWNSFLEIKWFGHLAFSWPFFNLEENSIFLGLFWINFSKTYNILWCFKKIWYILVNFLWKFGLYLAFFTIWEFGLFWNCLWSNLAFFIFCDLATLLYVESCIFFWGSWSSCESAQA